MVQEEKRRKTATDHRHTATDQNDRGQKAAAARAASTHTHTHTHRLTHTHTHTHRLTHSHLLVCCVSPASLHEVSSPFSSTTTTDAAARRSWSRNILHRLKPARSRRRGAGPTSRRRHMEPEVSRGGDDTSDDTWSAGDWDDGEPHVVHL